MIEGKNFDSFGSTTTGAFYSSVAAPFFPPFAFGSFTSSTGGASTFFSSSLGGGTSTKVVISLY